jgi:hypothetical protein
VCARETLRSSRQTREEIEGRETRKTDEMDIIIFQDTLQGKAVSALGPEHVVSGDIDFDGSPCSTISGAKRTHSSGLLQG